MFVDHPELSKRMFHPRPAREEANLRVDVGDATLACFHHNPHPHAVTLLHFHGNGELAAEYSRGRADFFLEMGVNVCFAEYRGYGSSTGQPALAAMLGDGEQILRALEVAPERVVAYGRSLGAVYSIELAQRQPTLAGLILESGVADVLEAIRLFLVGPEQLGCTEQELITEVESLFNHRQKLSNYRGPLLVLHARGDAVLDRSHAERLHDWGGGRDTRLVLFPAGDHNSLLAVNHEQYVRELQDFLVPVAASDRSQGEGDGLS